MQRYLHSNVAWHVYMWVKASTASVSVSLNLASPGHADTAALVWCVCVIPEARLSSRAISGITVVGFTALTIYILIIQQQNYFFYLNSFEHKPKHEGVLML